MGALHSPRNTKLVIKQLHSVKSHVMLTNGIFVCQDARKTSARYSDQFRWALVLCIMMSVNSLAVDVMPELGSICLVFSCVRNASCFNILLNFVRTVVVTNCMLL